MTNPLNWFILAVCLYTALRLHRIVIEFDEAKKNGKEPSADKHPVDRGSGNIPCGEIHLRQGDNERDS